MTTERTVVLLACEEDRRNKENSVADTKRVVDLVSRCRQLLKNLGWESGRVAIDFDAETYDLVVYRDGTAPTPVNSGSISGDPEVQSVRAQGQRAR